MRTATAATHYRFQRRIERGRQRASARPALLEEVKGHALRGLGTDARKGAEGVEELAVNAFETDGLVGEDEGDVVGGDEDV